MACNIEGQSMDHRPYYAIRLFLYTLGGGGGGGGGVPGFTAGVFGVGGAAFSTMGGGKGASFLRGASGDSIETFSMIGGGGGGGGGSFRAFCWA